MGKRSKIIHKYITKRLANLLDHYEHSDMTSSQMLDKLDKEINDKDLYDWIYHKFFMDAYKKGKILLSVGIFKVLFDKEKPKLKSNVLPDIHDYCFQTRGITYIINSNEVEIINKGLFINALERIGLSDFILPYIKYNLIRYKDTSMGYKSLTGDDIKRYKDKKKVWYLFLKLYGEKYHDPRLKILNFDKRELYNDLHS